jgi:predicted metal-dependent peptidase
MTDTAKQAHLEKRLARARWWMYNNSPFFCRLGQSLTTVWTEEIPTVAVDANGNLYFNAEFASKCTDMDLVFVYAHEVMHLVQMCHGRAPANVVHDEWNIAADACINTILVDDVKLEIISKAALDGLRPIYGAPNSADKDDILWHMLGKGTTEQGYYYLLKHPEAMGKNPDGSDPNGAPGSPGRGMGHSGKPTRGQGRGALTNRWYDDSGARIAKKADPKGKNENGQAQSTSGGMTEEQKAQWTQKIASAACAAKMQGNMPGALEQFVIKLLTPKRSWKNELRAFATATIKRQYTWKRIGRRTSSVVRTPGMLPDMPTAVVYIDTSGSMSDAELKRCLSETYAIAQLCNSEVHLILGDCVIYFSGKKKAQDLGNLKEVHRGGTSFVVLFEHIEKTFKKKPAILIGFTDLDGPFPIAPPSFPVVWCRPKSGYQHGHAPWGKVIEVEL